MKWAHFKRMKTKYKIRLIGSFVAMFLILLLVLWGIASLIGLVQTQLSTTTIKGITTENVLNVETMPLLLEVLGQEDSSDVLVADSVVTMDHEGNVTQVNINLINLTGSNTAETWLLEATPKKTFLRKLSSKADGVSALRLRKLELKNYYPALSRISTRYLLQYFELDGVVREGGQYVFTDQFENNLEPTYQPYIQRGLAGLWVSKSGGVSEFDENFVQIADCVPMIVSVQNPASGGSKRLGNPVETYVVLLEVGPYI